ncbi:MAG: protein kinase, partial [Vicinamibacterales bacterium]
DRGSVSQAPTITTPAMMTGVGMILGTAAYMSPEQAKGRPADKRSDVWAFGAVLYEMLTGSRPFEAEDVAETLAAVLMKEPDWSRVPATVPPAVRALLQGCLVKNRKDRVGDISSALFTLRHLTSLDVAERKATAPPAAPVRPWWTRALPVAAGAAIGAVLVGAAAWRTAPPPSPATVARFSFSLAEGQVLTTRQGQAVAASPDGTLLLYVADNQLYLRPVGDVSARSIPGTQLGVGTPTYPVFAPDGQSIAFDSSNDGKIRRIPIAGGTPVTLAGVFPGLTGMSWDESGLLVSAPKGGASQIIRMSPSGGTTETLATGVGPELLYAPQILADGQHLLFSVAPNPEEADNSKVVVQALSTGMQTTVLEHTGGGARYVPTGHLVYATGGTLFAVPFDVDTLAVRGSPVAVIEGVQRGSPGGGRPAQFAISNNGTVLYLPGPTGALNDAFRTLVLTRGASSTLLPIPAGPYVHPRVSRDGRRLAYGTDSAGKADIWVYDIGSAAAPRRLTFAGHARFPVWSGNGQFIAFQSEHEGDKAIFRQRADGSGATERLTRPDAGTEHVPESWSPDGAHLLYRVVKDGTHTLWDLTLGGTAAAIGGVRSVQPTGAVFSPDGRWLAYASSDVPGGAASPNRGIFIQPYPATGARYQAPKTSLDFHPAWAADGAGLFYVPAAASRPVMVKVQTRPTVAFGAVTALDRVPPPGLVGTFPRGYDVLPDGGFVTATDDAGGTGERPELRVILNWFEELKRLVPAK